MHPTRTLFLTLPLLALGLGCGGVKLIFKSPVESKCNSAGLKGCPEFTEGVLLYIEGKEDEGKDMLLRGAAQNAPAKVKKFAKAIRELKRIPGAASHVKPLMAVADILANAKGSGGAAGGAAGGGDAPPRVHGGGALEQQDEVLYEADESSGHREGGVATPATSRNACAHLGAYGSCMWVASGPMVVTELIVNPGCSSEMIVGTARTTDSLPRPRWISRSPHGINGERAFVRSGESMFVAVAGAASGGCSLTWAGFRP